MAIGGITKASGLPPDARPAGEPRPSPSSTGRTVARGFDLTRGDTPSKGRAPTPQGLGPENVNASRVIPSPAPPRVEGQIARAFNSLRPAPGSPWGTDATGKSGIVKDDAYQTHNGSGDLPNKGS